MHLFHYSNALVSGNNNNDHTYRIFIVNQKFIENVSVSRRYLPEILVNLVQTKRNLNF